MNRPYSHFFVTVDRVADLTPQMRQLTFTGPELNHFGDACLDQRIKLVIPRSPEDDLADFPDGPNWYADWRALPAGERRAVRTFTPAAVRPEVGEVDVIVARHGDIGPAARWAGAVQPGERAIIFGPDSRIEGHDAIAIEWCPEGADEVLIVGDETALPAIRSIMKSLPAQTIGRVVVEVPTKADRITLPAPDGVLVEMLPRNGKCETGELLVAALGADSDAVVAQPAAGGPAIEGAEDEVLWDTPEYSGVPRTGGKRFAWIAGEAGAVTTIRRHLVNHGWDRGEVAFMGYWRRGRAES